MIKKNLKKLKPKKRRTAKMLTYVLSVICFFIGLIIAFICYTNIIDSIDSIENIEWNILGMLGIFIGLGLLFAGVFAAIGLWGKPLYILDKFYPK